MCLVRVGVCKPGNKYCEQSYASNDCKSLSCSCSQIKGGEGDVGPLPRHADVQVELEGGRMTCANDAVEEKSELQHHYPQKDKMDGLFLIF